MQSDWFRARLGDVWWLFRRCLIVLLPLVVLDAAGSAVLAKKAKRFEALPEGPGVGSRAIGVLGLADLTTIIAVGEVQMPNDVWRAASWDYDGEVWRLELLPDLGGLLI